MSVSENALLESPGTSLNETMSAFKVAVVSDTIQSSVQRELGDASVDYMDLEINGKDFQRVANQVHKVINGSEVKAIVVDDCET